MSVEWFLKLKEIDSLTKTKDHYLKIQSEEAERLQKLEGRRQESLLRTATLKQDLFTHSHELSEIETRIKQSSEQRQRLIDMGGDDNKITSYSTEIGLLEEKGFVLLTKVDEIEQELADQKSFMSGLEKTIQEISQEINNILQKNSHELKNAEFRITSLMEELPEDFKRVLLKVSAKNLAHGPFTRIENGNCFFCRYKISRSEESEIDMNKSLKTCNQCGRIFLPYGS